MYGLRNFKGSLFVNRTFLVEGVEREREGDVVDGVDHFVALLALHDNVADVRAVTAGTLAGRRFRGTHGDGTPRRIARSYDRVAPVICFTSATAGRCFGC